MAAQSNDIIGTGSFVHDFDDKHTSPFDLFEKPYVDYAVCQGKICFYKLKIKVHISNFSNFRLYSGIFSCKCSHK